MPGVEFRTQAERTKEALLSGLEEGLSARFQTVESGPLEGVHVLTRADFAAAWGTFVADFVYPEVTEHAAEVTTPARVTVAAVCPHCHLTTDASVRLSVKLEETSTYARVKVIGRTDPVDHRCGQMAIRDVTPEGGGLAQTEAWDVGDITGGAAVGPEDMEDAPPEPGAILDQDAAPEPTGSPETPETAEGGASCPWPGCVRPEGHRGRHVKEDTSGTAEKA